MARSLSWTLAGRQDNFLKRKFRRVTMDSTPGGDSLFRVFSTKVVEWKGEEKKPRGREKLEGWSSWRGWTPGSSEGESQIREGMNGWRRWQWMDGRNWDGRSWWPLAIVNGVITVVPGRVRGFSCLPFFPCSRGPDRLRC